MAIRVDLNYTLRTGSDGISFSTPTSVGTANRRNYLNATGSDPVAPVVFTSSDPTIAKVTLEQGSWYLDYLSSGTVTITATQGSDTSNKTITINPTATGRIINAVADTENGNQYLRVDGSTLNLLPGDTIMLPGGTYSGVEIKNIVIPDGGERVTVTCTSLVEVAGDFNTWNFTNLRNVNIDGSRVQGLKHGMMSRDNAYYTVYVSGPMNFCTFSNFAMQNGFNAGWTWDNGSLEYNGTPESYYQGCKFINFLVDGAGSFSIDGSLDMTKSTGKIMGLVVDFQFIGWELKNCSSGGVIRVSCGQDIVFKNIKMDGINNSSNNHNAILFCQGTADVINCNIRNFEGNTIRLWYWTLVDGHINGRTTRKTCIYAGNIAWVSRKYSAFEWQAFDNFFQAGVTDVVDIAVFHNTVGNMNQNRPLVFTGTLCDPYGLRGGSYTVFNNVGMALINPDSNNIWFTYGSAVSNGQEISTGPEQEYNNRSYSDYQSAKISPLTLAPQSGSTAIGNAVQNQWTAMLNEDLYGNPMTMRNIGAVQVIEAPLPSSLPAPLAPSTSNTLENINSTQPDLAVMIDAKLPYSPVGVMNYDIEVNNVFYTSKGAYPRTGKQDPAKDNPDFLPLPGTTYKFRFRARDWRNQLSPWSDPYVMRTHPNVIEATTPLVFTKTSGGTLVKTGEVYTATGSTVYAVANLTIPDGYSARLLITTANPAIATGVLGLSSSATITSLAQIRSGMKSQHDTPSRMSNFINGVETDFTNDNVAPRISCLFVNFDNKVWREISDDGGLNFGKFSTSRYAQFQLGEPLSGTKYIHIVLEPGQQINTPRYLLFPAIDNSYGDNDLTFTGSDLISGNNTYSKVSGGHSPYPANKSILAGKSARVWADMTNTDSNFILGLDSGVDAPYAQMDYSIQVGYNQYSTPPSMAISARQNSESATLVAYSYKKYVGLLRGEDGVVKIQTSDNNQIWTDEVFTFDNTTTGQLNISMSLDNQGVIHYPTLTNLLPLVSADFKGDTNVYFGDSIVAGAYVDPAQRWTTLLSSQANAVEDNRGVSGQTLESVVQAYNCGKTYFNTDNVPTKLVSHNKLFLAYNTNDILVNKPYLTPSNFKGEYVSAIQRIIQKGWLASDIVLVNGYYLPNLGLSVSECTVTEARTRAEAEQFVSMVNDVSSLTGTMLADTYSITKNNSSYTTVDGVHPTPLGHKQIANYLRYLTYTKNSSRS